MQSQVEQEEPIAADLAEFSAVLRASGLHEALRFLNGRTSHRYTGVFRFDGDMLRNIAMVDKWDRSVTCRDDVPLAEAYCAYLHRTGEAVRVDHGPSDVRFPWMADSPFLSYCGAIISDARGEHWGALCHFDVARCESRGSELPLVVGAASMLYPAVASSCRAAG